MSRGQTLYTIREMRDLKEDHTLTKASSPTKRIPALRETTAPCSPFTEIVISSDMRATFYFGGLKVVATVQSTEPWSQSKGK